MHNRTAWCSADFASLRWPFSVRLHSRRWQRCVASLARPPRWRAREGCLPSAVGCLVLILEQYLRGGSTHHRKASSTVFGANSLGPAAKINDDVGSKRLIKNEQRAYPLCLSFSKADFIDAFGLDCLWPMWHLALSRQSSDLVRPRER